MLTRFEVMNVIENYLKQINTNTLDQGEEKIILILEFLEFVKINKVLRLSCFPKFRNSLINKIDEFSQIDYRFSKYKFTLETSV